MTDENKNEAEAEAEAEVEAEAKTIVSKLEEGIKRAEAANEQLEQLEREVDAAEQAAAATDAEIEQYGTAAGKELMNAIDQEEAS